jgi:uncharacterized protein
MEILTATEFARGFGKRNQDVQQDIIQVTSHGRPIGYYISPREYQKLQHHNTAPCNPGSMYDRVMAKRKDILALAKRHSARSISLFGSVARKEDTANSDIDFLVDFPEIYDFLHDRLQLSVELEELLDQHVDLVVKAEMNKDIAPYILKEAIEL